ncbi:MAG TPA: nitrite transporter [Pseudomonas sp.]|nr:nitrite transporter [Pseudomonas sp.]MBB50248.1 nitrite transporter [Pseudomonadales bacterium]MBB50504.1 nitrite transporter [Pseudomonadales bacterium]HCA25264.1 nitrite transporter [Pseudomonas sp.]|tara:strand:+ start:196 stop:573 length:378 start_codon:yes stop_codon:yes gene_type:complete
MDLSKYTRGVYVEGGRVWPQVDCYSMVLEVRRDMGLPDWPDWPGTQKAAGEMAAVADGFLPCLHPCEPHPGAMVVCYEGRCVSHCGVIVEVAGMLEVLDIRSRSGVKCLPLSRFVRAFNRVEFYD